jgi:hypothetical protein
MAIVTERLEAKKPPQSGTDPKLSRGAVNNNKDLEVDLKKEEPSFFSTFFSGAKGQTVKKKGAPVMESVGDVSYSYHRN